MTLNNVAIDLAKEIETKILYLVAQVSGNSPDSLKQAPNFYMLRETILKTLNEKVVLMSVNTTTAPYMLEQMTLEQKQDYLNHMLKKEAGQVIEEVLKRDDIIDKFEFEDEFDMYRSTTKTIAFLKVGKND